jgi:hypothetical protein
LSSRARASAPPPSSTCCARARLIQTVSCTEPGFLGFERPYKARGASPCIFSDLRAAAASLRTCSPRFRSRREEHGSSLFGRCPAAAPSSAPCWQGPWRGNKVEDAIFFLFHTLVRSDAVAVSCRTPTSAEPSRLPAPFRLRLHLLSAVRTPRSPLPSRTSPRSNRCL